MKKLIATLILACLWTGAHGQERQFKSTARIIKGQTAGPHVTKGLVNNGIQPRAAAGKAFRSNRNMPPMGDQSGVVGGRRMPAMGPSTNRRFLTNRGGPVNR